MLIIIVCKIAQQLLLEPPALIYTGARMEERTIPYEIENDDVIFCFHIQKPPKNFRLAFNAPKT